MKCKVTCSIKILTGVGISLCRKLVACEEGTAIILSWTSREMTTTDCSWFPYK